MKNCGLPPHKSGASKRTRTSGCETDTAGIKQGKAQSGKCSERGHNSQEKNTCVVFNSEWYL